MANTLKIELVVDDKGSVTVKQFGQTTETAMKVAGDATKGLGQNTEQLASSSKSSFETIKGQWLAVTAAAAGAVAIAKGAINAYMEEEAAQMKLAVAMRNQGDFTREGFAALKDYAAQIQETTKYGDELTLATMANLKTYGMNTEELKRATEASLNLATAKGMDLTAASELVGKAFVGETGTLSRYGIVVDEGIGKTEKFDAVLGQIQGRFGGAAQAELNTYAGQWQQLQNQWGDMQEVLGLGLLKSIQAVLVGAGLIGTTFLSAGTVVLKTIDTMTTPFQWLLKGFAALAEFAGMDRAADALRTVAGATGEARENIDAAKEATLAWTSRQYDAMVATEQVTKAAEKMGNATKAAAKASAEEVKAANEAIVAAAKSRFDTETAMAKDYYSGVEAEIKNQEQILKLSGNADSKIMANTINLKYAALEGYYASEEKLIALAAAARSKDERKKLSDAEFTAAKLTALDSSVLAKKQELAGLELVAVAQKNKEISESHKKAGEDAAAAYKIVEEADKKLLDVRKSDLDTYQKMVAAESDFAVTENERAINKIISDYKGKIKELNNLQESGNLKYKDYMDLLATYNANKNKAVLEKEKETALKISTAMYDMISGIKGKETEAYNLRLVQIEAEKQKRIQDAGSTKEAVVAAAEWAKQKQTDAYIAMLSASDNWKDGVAAGLLELERRHTTWGQTLKDITVKAADDAASAFGSNFKDVVKGDFDNLGDAWNSMLDNMLTTLGTNIGKMIMKAAAKDILMMFHAEWTADSSEILGIINKGMDIFNWLTGGSSGGGSITNDTGLSDLDPSMMMAKGGPFEAGTPFWAGEKGPEIIFPTTSGHVLTHEQSMLYAARNGGYIPGYAEGTGVDMPTAAQMATLDAFRDYWANLQGFGKGAEPPFRSANYYNDDDWWISPDGQLHDTRHADRGFLDYAVPGIIAIGGGYASGNLAVGTAIISSTMSGASGDKIALAGITAYAAQVAGQYVGSAINDIYSAAGTTGAEALAGSGWSGLYDASDIWGLVKEVGLVAVKAVAKNAVKAAMQYALGSIFGGGAGGGAGKFSFAGVDGDMDWLSSLMGDIAPKESNFNVNPFKARNGIDYIPRDNFPILGDEGEAVLTKEENKKRRSGKGRGDVVINLHYHGTVIEEKKAAERVAKMVYPELDKLARLGY